MAKLSTEQIQRIKAYKEMLGESDICSLEKAISDFELDVDPNIEIEIWEGIARDYAVSINDDMTAEEKDDITVVVVKVL